MIKVMVMDLNDPEKIWEQLKNGNADVVIVEAFLDRNKGHFCFLFVLGEVEKGIFENLQKLEELTEETPINSRFFPDTSSCCFLMKADREKNIDTLRKIDDVEIVQEF